MNLGDQFLAIITPRIGNLPQVAESVAVDIKDRMLENTSQGRTFGNAEYVPTYSVPYARRAKAGKISPVTLRGVSNTIETAHITADADDRTIRFTTSHRAPILKYHHTGRARGGKVRTIFPKQIDQVPTETRFIAQQGAFEVLSG